MRSKRKKNRDHLFVISKNTSERQKTILMKRDEIIKKGYTWVDEDDIDMIASVVDAIGGFVFCTAIRNGKMRLHPSDDIINGRIRTGNTILDFIINHPMITIAIFIALVMAVTFFFL